MQNQAIEIHDSVVDRIAIQDGTAVIHFPSVYIHRSDGTPAVDAGTVWTQEAVLYIGDAKIEGTFSEEVREAHGYDLHSGSLRMGQMLSDNLIPIPLDMTADIELTLESCGYSVRVSGISAHLGLVGEAEYVEEFKP